MEINQERVYKKDQFKQELEAYQTKCRRIKMPIIMVTLFVLPFLFLLTLDLIANPHKLSVEIVSLYLFIPLSSMLISFINEVSKAKVLDNSNLWNKSVNYFSFSIAKRRAEQVKTVPKQEHSFSRYL